MPAEAASSERGYVEPRAAWRVTLNGTDLADKLDPRLISLRLSEKRGEAADELEIVLHDHDGKLAIPPAGARLSLELGWGRGSAVPIGLVPKGSFKVDELRWEGPPDTVTITARSADLKDSFRARKSNVWKATTIGGIVSALAGAQGLSPRCHPALAGKSVTAAEQHNKSDMQFLRDLGRRYDAVATVKDGSLIFAPVNAATTATGKAIPTLTVTRQSGDRYSFSRASRDNGQDGAEAQWHDQGEARRKKVSHGGGMRRRLKRIYASEGDASAASAAETNRLARAAASFELTLAYGHPAASPGQRVTARGFKAEVDSKAWLLAEVEHTMDGSGGYRTSLKMEVAG